MHFRIPPFSRRTGSSRSWVCNKTIEIFSFHTHEILYIIPIRAIYFSVSFYIFITKNNKWCLKASEIWTAELSRVVGDEREIWNNKTCLRSWCIYDAEKRQECEREHAIRKQPSPRDGATRKGNCQLGVSSDGNWNRRIESARKCFWTKPGGYLLHTFEAKVRRKQHRQCWSAAVWCLLERIRNPAAWHYCEKRTMMQGMMECIAW